MYKKGGIYFIFLLILGFLTGPRALLGQSRDLRFKNISEKDGLLSNIVFSILQDQKGFIWIGTEAGLCRYDGKKFISYRHSSLDSNSLSGNYCRALWEDKEGNIWIGLMDAGLNKFSPDKGGFEHYNANPDNPNSLTSDVIFSITGDKNGNLWIATNNGISCFDIQTKNFRNYRHNPSDASSPSNNQIRYIYCDKKNNLWVCTGEGGLDCFNPQSGGFIHYGKPDKEAWINTLFEDQSGNLWAGTNNSIALFNPEKRTFTSYHYLPEMQNPPPVYSLTEDDFGNLWIGTHNGLFIFDKTSQTFSEYHHNPENETGLGGNFVRVLLKDKSDNIWLGTSGPEMSIRLSTIKRFQKHYYQKDNPNSLKNKHIFGMSETAEGIWIGTRSGLIRYYEQRFEEITAINYTVYGVIPDIMPYLWLYTNKGIVKFNTVSRKSELFSTIDNKPGTTDIITAAQKDINGNIWFSPLNKGIYKLDVSKKAIQEVPFRDGKVNSSNIGITNVLKLDSTGYLWIGTGGGGLWGYDLVTGQYKQYFTVRNKPVSKVINSMEINTDGTLWLGTYSGLYKYNPKTDENQLYSEKEGLCNNIVSTVLKEKEDILWIATNKGLSLFNPSSGKFRNYDLSDGLLENNFTTNAGIITKNHKVLLGSINGIVEFSLEDLPENKHLPEVHITEMRLFNIPVLAGDQTGILKNAIENSQEIHLKHFQNFLSFEFCALDYAQPEKNQFAYKLNGVDKDWIYSGVRNFTSYADLKPGEYELKVIASNNDGLWNHKGTSLKIIIHPAFWQTTAFKLTLILLFVLASLGFYRYRLKQILRAEADASKIRHLTQQALRAQMNPHFIFNCLNAIDKYILMNDRLKASLYLNKFAKLIRNILLYSEKKSISLKDELQMLEYYMQMENLRMEYPFTYRFEIKEGVNPESIEIPPMILQPYIENAIRHGLIHKQMSGFIEIEVSLKENLLCISISDDGIGRKKSAEIQQMQIKNHISKGTQITADRIKLLNQENKPVILSDITDDSGNVTGTKVVLTLII